MFKVKPNKDTPQLESINLNALAGAGSGSDYEHVIVALPNLGQGAPSGLSGAIAQNAMFIRWVGLTFEATLTGATTNNVTYNVLQRRTGNLLVNTTSATTIVAGTQAVTPASMANIYPNTKLVLSGGTGATETVVVSSVTGTTFTATFVNGHSGGYTITAAPLATITYASGVSSAAFVQTQLAANSGNVVLGGDVLTLQRVSNGTGLATPSLTVTLDWVNTGTL